MYNARPPISPKENQTSTDRSEEYEESYDSEYSSERSGGDDRKERSNKRETRKITKQRNRERARERKYRDRSRDKKNESQVQMRESKICSFHLQGNCDKVSRNTNQKRFLVCFNSSFLFFFFQSEDCQFNHDVLVPLKLELCKFYLMDCCAKGDKCLYMHSEFPCKFYHTGLNCFAGTDCKFAHGKPLNDCKTRKQKTKNIIRTTPSFVAALKQVLFKHIETAPKEILGEFPRLSREGAQTRISQAQKSLEAKFGLEKKDSSSEGGGKNNIPSLFDINVPMPPELMQNDGSFVGGDCFRGAYSMILFLFSDKKDCKTDKPQRNRPSRWQDPDPVEKDKKSGVPSYLGFIQRDQDMRISSNGDIDMRTIPPHLAALPAAASNMLLSSTQLQSINPEQYKRDNSLKDFSKDIDIRTNVFDRDIDIRQKDMDARKKDDELFASKDTDIRGYGQVSGTEIEEDNNMEESNLQIVLDEESDVKPEQEPARDSDTRTNTLSIPPNLPKTQRDLLLRIRAQQKDNLLEEQPNEASDQEDNNVDWYSDDEDDPKLTIKVDEEKEPEILSPAPIKPLEVVEKLGDLSKIDISAEVTRLLSTINQNATNAASRDPRQAAVGGSTETNRTPPTDPRVTRRGSVDEKKIEKVSIYEQSLQRSDEEDEKDLDLRNLDIRNSTYFGLIPFPS